MFAKDADATSAQPGPRQQQGLRNPQNFVLRGGEDDARITENMLRAIDSWLKGGPAIVTVQRYEPKKSLEQHGLFWAWCARLALHLRDAGMAACEDSVHDWILGSVYGWEDMGLGRTRPRRTLTRPHRMGKMTMMELLSRFESEANTEFSCQLPRPATWDADVAEARREREKERLKVQRAGNDSGATENAA